MKFIFSTVLVFCFSLFLAANANAALYSTYADVSNPATFTTSRTREVLQIFKMPVQGRINSIRIKAGGFDGGGTAMLRPGVCRVANNSVGAACVGSYIWANESPWILPGMKWYTYTFPAAVFDKDAYVKFYFYKTGPALYEQTYGAISPSSTYANGLTWLNRPNSEISADIQIILDIEPTVKKTPIVIVPGILGSYLYNMAGEEVWPNIPKMLLPGDDYLNELVLNNTGIPDAQGSIFSTDLIRILYGQDFFGGLINELKNSGYEEEKDLFVFPYDWRLDIKKSSDDLKNKIDDIRAQTGAGKINIIAHSMGGLVAKEYIRESGQDSVDKFIDIATPHLGAPKAFKILAYGDDLDIKALGHIHILNGERIKNISQNMPAIYQLLPSRKYFGYSDSDYNSYISDIYDVDQNNITGNLNFDQSMKLMENTGRNEYLLTQNDGLHNEIDNFDPLVYGAKAYNIVGCGQPTIGKTYILNKERNGYEYGLKYISGDATVPLKSAEDLKNTVNTYYTTGAEHSLMPSFSGVKELVTAIVNDQAANFNYSQYSNIKQNRDACALNGWQVSFHSPIELHVYDEKNNHLGSNQNGDIEMGIEGASYDVIDGNKFAFLPKGHTYRIVGQAIDSGSFNARVQDIQNSETMETQYFNSVTLNSTSTNVEYNLNDQTKNVAIQIDQDGDHIFENTVEPSAVLNQAESQDTTKPQTTAVADGILGQNSWYKSDVQISLSGQDNENGSGILKIEYSLDGDETWQEYFSPIVLNNDGRYNIQYRTIDKAGNIENVNEISANIDKTSPVIDVFTPLNASEYLRSDNINPAYDISDELSGVATDTIKIVVDNTDLNTSTINLFDFALGSHVIIISAQDLAGNTASTTINFSVSANLESALFDVNELYSRGWLNEKASKQLIGDLNLIKKQIEKFGQKKIIIDTKFAGAMKKCVAKKGIDWCETKLKPRLDKSEYMLNKIYQKIISLQYQLIIAELNQYQKKTWINLQAHNILKEDVYFLINEFK